MDAEAERQRGLELGRRWAEEPFGTRAGHLGERLVQ
jgi:hypothetical protein